MKNKFVFIVLLFFSIISLTHAQDYNLEFEIYKVDNVESFYDDVYSIGEASLISADHFFKRGDILAVGVKYSTGDFDDAIGFQIGYGYDNRVLEPFLKNDQIYYDFNESLSSWTMPSPNIYDSKILSTMYDMNLYPTQASGSDLIYFAYFTVKNDALYSESFSFLFDDDYTLGANELAQERTITTEDISFNVLSYNATLSNIEIDGVGVEGFSSDIYEYNITLPYLNNDDVLISALASDINSSISGATTVNLVTTDVNKVDIVVTALDGTILTYTVNITREKNTDNSLNDLSILGNLATWNSELNLFEVTFGSDVDSFNSDDVTGSVGEGALLIPSAGFDVAYGTNDYFVTVTSEDGNSKVYDVVINRDYKNNALLSEIKIDNNLIGEFGSNTFSYDISVLYDVSSIEISALTVDADAFITAGELGVKSLDVGLNSFEILVTAHDAVAKQSYTLNITREENSDNSLNGLSILGESAIWNNDLGRYEVSLGSEITSFTKDDVVGNVSDTATFIASEKSNLVYGNNDYNVSVEAQNGEVKEYDVLIIRSFKTNALLSEIKIDNNLIGEFDSNTFSYDISVLYDVSSIEISALTVDADAFITDGNLGVKSLDVGLNSFEILVTAHDAVTKQSYTLNITREENTDNSLNNLSILGNLVTWNSELNLFEVSLLSSDDSFVDSDVNGVVGEGATINVGIGMDLNYGNNNYSVSVTSQSGSIAYYNVIINRPYKINSLLDSVLIDDVLINNFDSNIFSYNVNVSNETDSINLSAVASDVDALISGTGDKDLNVGINAFEIVVTAHDGITKQSYMVNINRLQSSNNGIDSLTILGNLAAYNVDKDLYEVTVNSLDLMFDETDIEVVTTDLNASVDVGLGMNLDYGINNYDITVSAQDGSEVIYNINITRPYKVNALLSEIKIDNNLITDFDSNTFSYDVSVLYDVSSVEISALTVDADAFITDGNLGVKSLDVGLNTFEILVTAHDTVTKQSYTLNITREENSDNSLNGLSILGESAIWNNDLGRYEVTLGSEVTAFTKDDVVGNVSDTATFIASEKSNLVYGNNDYNVSVEAQNGEVKEYEVLIIRSFKTNALLSEIKIDNNLIGEFDSNTFSYDISVLYDVSSIEISALTVDEDAFITDGSLGVKSLDVGLNSFEILVTAHDAVTKQSYTLNITREELIVDEVLTPKEGSNHVIGDDYIDTVKLDDSVLDFKNQLDNDNSMLYVYESDGSTLVSNESSMATGMIIKLIKNEVVLDSKQIVVMGDVNGDASINLFDSMKLINAYLLKETVTGVYARAGDLNSNMDLDLSDSMRIINHYLSKELIH